MQELNKYGFYSGGYIFDVLDRVALATINKKYPNTKKQQIYTTHADVFFTKQLCTSEFEVKVMSTNSWVDSDGKHVYRVMLELVAGDAHIANGLIMFALAKRNYCKVKKGVEDGTGDKVS